MRLYRSCPSPRLAERFTNLTVTENRAEGAPSPTTGGWGIGGGIYAATETEVHYATFAKNEAVDGGNTAASGSLFLKNTMTDWQEAGSGTVTFAVTASAPGNGPWFYRLIAP